MEIIPPVPMGMREKDREKLASLFARRMLEDFELYGAGVIAEVRASKPHAYLQLVAAFTPKQIDVAVHKELDALTDEELDAFIVSQAEALQGDTDAAQPDADSH